MNQSIATRDIESVYHYIKTSYFITDETPINTIDFDKKLYLEEEICEKLQTDIEQLRCQGKSYYSKTQDKDMNTGRWSDKEKSLFSQGIKIFGHGKWRSISNFVRTRFVYCLSTPVVLASNKNMYLTFVFLIFCQTL